jgi:hypothetical protein
MASSICLHANIIELEYNVCADCGLVLADSILYSAIDVSELEINGTGTYVTGGTQTLIGKTHIKIQYSNQKSKPLLDATTVDTLKKLDMYSGHTLEISSLVRSVTSITTCRAKMKQALIVWCIYYTYKRHGKLISVDKLRDDLSLTKTHITRASRLINETTRKHYPELYKEYLTDIHPIESISDLIEKSGLNMYKTNAKQMYDYIQDKYTLKGTVSSIVKSVFYYTVKHKTTIDDYAAGFEISKVTLRMICNQIEKFQ